MRNAFVTKLCSLAGQEKNIFLLTGDLGFGVLTKFWEEYPERFINAGICEQNMTSVAAGLALEGKNVFTYSIANFPTMRCLEQIRNDVAYHDANVTIVAVGGGFSYGALGMSHHATEDIAIMRALPNMHIFTPCDPMEAEKATEIAASFPHPCYIRLGRGGEKPLAHQTNTFKLGSSNILKEGKNVAILSAGAIANEAVDAADLLNEENIRCAVYSFFTVKPIDEQTIVKVTEKYEHIFTVEEHNVVGGFGSAVSDVCAQYGCHAKVHKLGLQDEYTSIVGSQEYLRNAYGISAIKIKNTIEKIMEEKK